jgi:hypothetical protein
MGIQFNKPDRLIVVTSGQISVTVQTLINEIRNYEDNPENMELDTIANATGKQDLGGGAQVGITLQLVNDWQIAFSGWAGTSPHQSVSIAGGNITAVNSFDNRPIDATSSIDTFITIQQSTSPSIIGTTSAEIASAVWNANTETYTSNTTFGEKVGNKLLTVAKFLGLK